MLAADGSLRGPPLNHRTLGRRSHLLIREGRRQLAISRTQPDMSSVLDPRLPSQPEPIQLKLADIGDDGCFADAIVKDGSLTDLRAGRLEFSRFTLRHVDLQGAELPRLELTDVFFDQSDLANGKWAESILFRTRFVDSRLTGSDLAGSSLRHVTFERCALDLSSFRLASFKDAAFRDCMMQEADFAGAGLSGVRFANCDLRQTQFSGAKLDGTEFRGSQIDGLRIAPENLRGVIVDSSQMTVLAWAVSKHFGIIVRDSKEEA